jgi:hypothetical protein
MKRSLRPFLSFTAESSMKYRLAWIAVVLVAVGLSIVGQTHRTRAQPAAQHSSPDNKTTAAELAGAASCSGRACHGGLTPEKTLIQQNEYSTWFAHDKHAQAYNVLLGERGKRIAVNLGIVAHTDPRCLACHVTAETASKDTPPEFLHLREEGVGCEACHGPARAKAAKGAWLVAHTLADWRTGDEATRRKRFVDHSMSYLTDLTVQAEACAGCHVGGPAEEERGLPALDVNHDIIAAGHPRLYLELGVFREHMPPHWRADKYKGDPGYEAKTWAVGQAFVARASLALLGWRAKQASRGAAPWPEFAAYDCFACHADFGSPSWRRESGYYGRGTPGRLPFNRWPSAMLPALAKFDPTGKKVLDDFVALENAMSLPYPDPRRITAEVQAALPRATDLVKAMENAKYDAPAIASLRASVLEMTTRARVLRWDEVEQMALALGALGRDDSALIRLFNALAYPSGYDSPEQGQDGGKRRQALEKAIEELQRSK